MKIAWVVGPHLTPGDPADLLIKTENNVEAIALRHFINKFGLEMPKECLPQVGKDDAYD